MAQEQTAHYDGATSEEASAKFRADAAKAEGHGFVPKDQQWSERDGRQVLTVTYGQRSAWGQPSQPSAPPAAQVIYDRKDQYDQILPWVLDNERLFAVYDCKGAGTGFVAITNKRLLFYDKAPLRKRKALMSVPFSKVTAVGSVDQGRGLLGATSELVVKAGSDEYDFEFRGGEKAQEAYRFIMRELLQGET